jgi:hypothetical protein
MRLLLRANAHRLVDGGESEIAASPDTPGSEPWQWHLRVLDDSRAAPSAVPGCAAIRLQRSDGATSLLTLVVDESVVDQHVEMVDVSTPVLVERKESELVAVVVGRGTALVEGRHLLRELDTLIFAGDDPLDACIEQVWADPTSIALVRLRPIGVASISWIP